VKGLLLLVTGRILPELSRVTGDLHSVDGVVYDLTDGGDQSPGVGEEPLTQVPRQEVA
jgi:hypothetical protein